MRQWWAAAMTAGRVRYSMNTPRAASTIWYAAPAACLAGALQQERFVFDWSSSSQPQGSQGAGGYHGTVWVLRDIQRAGAPLMLIMEMTVRDLDARVARLRQLQALQAVRSSTLKLVSLVHSSTSAHQCRYCIGCKVPW